MVVVTRLRFGKRNLGLLSTLEEDVLKILWRGGGGYKVREVHSILRKRRKVALTSIAVILDRLYQKKIAARKIKTARGGEYYIYFCRSDRRNFQESVIEKTVDKLIDSFGDIAVTYFNERFSKRRKQ